MKFKKIILYFIFFIFLINLASLILIQIKFNENVYNFKSYIEKKKSLSIKNLPISYIHPFLGNIFLDNKKIKNNNLTDEYLINDVFHYKGNEDDKSLKILILGGSVAKNLTNNIADKNSKKKNILGEKFKELMPDKNFAIYNASITAGKQPQQLFKLYYLYLLGIKYDVVINFDGPQELAQPFVKNYPLNDEAIYPRRYSDDVMASSKNYQCIVKHNKFAKQNSFIPIIELYSLYFMKKCLNKVYSREGGKAPWKNSDGYVKRDKKNIIEKSIKIWRKSSVQIENFANQNKFQYLHVIMPNQYLEDSKIFNSEELKNYFGYEYGPILKQHYNEINFNKLNIKHSLDLKYIFKDFKETVYRDKCCRFNDVGLTIISNEIVKYLKENILN